MFLEPRKLGRFSSKEDDVNEVESLELKVYLQRIGILIAIAWAVNMVVEVSQRSLCDDNISCIAEMNLFQFLEVSCIHA